MNSQLKEFLETYQKTETSTQRGAYFVGFVALVFIILKVTGAVNWSWIWVLLPLWGPVVVAPIAAVILIVILLLIFKKLE